MLLFYLSLVDDPEDKSRIEVIYTDFYPYMFAKANSVLSNDFDVEDAIQNAMLRIIELIDEINFDDMEKVKALCGIIARNKAIDLQRQKDNQHVDMYDIPPSDVIVDDPGEIVVDDESYDILIGSINKLDDIFKDVFCLKYYLGYKEREIADILGISQKTVGTRLYRGRRDLRKILEEANVHV